MTQELAQKWRRYKDTGDLALRNELVEHYLPLVKYMARRVVTNAPVHQDRGEFESFGYFGLIDAVEKFDPDSNVNSTTEEFSFGRAFETYAVRRIQGAILDGLRRDDPLTRSARKKVKDTEKATDSLQRTLGRYPSVEELAAELGVDVAEQRVVMQSMRTMNTSLDATSAPMGANHVNGGGQDDGLPGAHLPNVRFDDPQLAVEISEAGRIMADALVRLPERDRVFAALYYCEQMSLTEIGTALGISESRVGQIRLRVIQALRQG